MSPTQANATEAMCATLHDFVAGELSDEAADAFRLHLGTCESCPGELGELLQLAALEDAAAADAIEAPEDAVSKAQPIDELAARRRKRIAVFAVAGALAAAAALFLIIRRGPTTTHAPVELALATAPQRPLELRVSAADDYRPYEVMRSGELPTEEISFTVLAKLEETGALQRLANAHLLMREADKAEALLAEIEPTASVLADRGVAAALRGDNHAALRYFAESLEKDPDNPRVLWNQAVIYRDLNLPLGAAKLFDQVAKLGEPGWSEEAAKNAAALRGAKEATEAYKKAYTAGSGQIAEGKVLALDIVSRYPGLGRLLFYEAARSAGTPEALGALAPHAKAIDAYDGSDVATRLLTRLARLGASNWKRRSPLAARYRVLAQSSDRANEAEALVVEARKAGADAILFGALVYTGRLDVAVAREAEAVAASFGDPWFTLGARELAIMVLMDQGRLIEAESLADAVVAGCRESLLAYRCGRLALRRLVIKQRLYKVAEAHEAAIEALDWSGKAEDAFAISDIRHYIGQGEMLSDEARSTTAAMARAYLDEELIYADDSCSKAYIFRILSRLSFRERNDKQASLEDREAEHHRRECGGPIDTGTAYIRAGILGRRPVEAEVKAFRDDIATARESASDLAKAELDLAEGRLLLQHEPELGEPILRRAISAIDASSGAGVETRQVRSLAYALLALSKSERGDHGSALAELAAESGRTAPPTCAVGLAFEFRLGVITVDAAGTVSGRYEPNYDLSEEPLEPGDLEAMNGCDSVAVIARAPFYGRARLLPDDVAWSFVRGGARAPATLPAKSERLVVAETLPPASLGLPLLKPWTREATTVLLAGATATPDRVMAALTTATEVEIHAHGLPGGADGDGFLALSPGSNGEFRLSAEKIAGLDLRGSPLVVLAACNAARSAAYIHEPWGLPIAFLRAGARTIIASPNPIPDSSSYAFFAAVRKKLLTGVPPAIAVRDVRMEWRERAPESGRWAAEVLVFE